MPQAHGMKLIINDQRIKNKKQPSPWKMFNLIFRNAFFVNTSLWLEFLMRACNQAFDQGITRVLHAPDANAIGSEEMWQVSYVIIKLCRQTWIRLAISISG